MYPGGCCYMLLLHAYTLAGFLGFVDVLFQSIVFEYMCFTVVLFILGVYGDGANLGAWSVYMQNVFMHAEKAFSGR